MLVWCSCSCRCADVAIELDQIEMAQNLLATYLSSHPKDWNVWKKCVHLCIGCYVVGVLYCLVLTVLVFLLHFVINTLFCRAIDIEFNLNNFKEVSSC